MTCYLAAQSRAAPPADEVAGLLESLRIVRKAHNAAVWSNVEEHFNRLENHLKGKR